MRHTDREAEIDGRPETAVEVANARVPREVGDDQARGCLAHDEGRLDGGPRIGWRRVDDNAGQLPAGAIGLDGNAAGDSGSGNGLDRYEPHRVVIGGGGHLAGRAEKS